jgi:hypothetical protein
MGDTRAGITAFAFATALVAGCATPGMEPDKYYPSDWAPIVAGGDCQSLQRTYENRGVLVDEQGRRSATFMTDLFGKRFARQEVIDARIALQRYEFATVRLEPGIHHWRSAEPRWNVVLELSHGRQRSSSVADEPGAILKLVPATDDRTLGSGGWCHGGTLTGFGSEAVGSFGNTNCELGAALDGSLVVRCIHRYAGIAIVVPFFGSHHFWAKFGPK